MKVTTVKIRERLKSLIPFDLLYGRKLKRVIEAQEKVGRQWDVAIREYQDGKIAHHFYTPKQDLGTDKIIWQYWGQGIDWETLPEPVKICFDSVDKYSGDYRVIRLSDEQISEFLDIPIEIIHKSDTGQMQRAFFSDLLRVMLLATYGGVWLDATILMTGGFPKEFTTQDHFCFQRDQEEDYKAIWAKEFIYYYGWHPNFQVNVLNSILWSKKGGQMMTILSDLLLDYWQKHDTSEEYFFFQILYNRLVSGAYSHLKPRVVSDCSPHILQAVINGTILPYSYEDALRKSNLHKLTYFDRGRLKRLKRIIEQIH